MLTAFVMLAGGLFGIAYVWTDLRSRRTTMNRLTELIGAPIVTDTREEARRRIRSYPPRYRVLAPAAGAVVAGAMWLGLGLPGEISIAVGVLVGVMAHLVDAHVAEQRAGTIEMQLASSIDLMVGSLRAGASLLAAFESALQEAEVPLRPYLQEVAGRIRLGDDPRAAVTELQSHVPLETFRLFTTSLAIHWEVGGSLATTLSTVGRTVRDRIELSRRVRAQAVESNASVAVVLLIAYVLGFLMWRTNPDRLEGFIQTGVGTTLVAGVIGLQAIGLMWMSRLSRGRL